MARQKIKYLSNKELLFEINRSKKTYCSFIDEKYENFDIIVNSLNELQDPEKLEEGKLLRAKRLKELRIRELILAGEDPKKYDTNVDTSEISDQDVVFRVMTYEHIPLDLERKKTHKTEADKRVKVPFHPFKHYIIEDGELKEVGRSHWKDGVFNGEFCLEHGYITDRLAGMFMKLVARYSLKPNWRGYSYIDEMRSNALLQFSSVGLKFDESKSENPFAYYTQMIKNSFRGNLITEKKVQNIRDELLIAHGSNPSNTMTSNESWEASNRQLDRPGSPKKGNSDV